MAIYLFPFWGLARANGGKVGTGCFAFFCLRLKLEVTDVFDQQQSYQCRTAAFPTREFILSTHCCRCRNWKVARGDARLVASASRWCEKLVFLVICRNAFIEPGQHNAWHHRTGQAQCH
jgi:hypothetical protein